ncbi:MAG TPA: hypothetical protein EYG67_05560 [Campylobacterales bacterium]|nr:hypothetical protein [Campylobacterales bacterium]HIP42152.1 hypothetical protein [Campylobacterales bacterium]
MLEIASQIIIFIILATVLGVFIGYFFAKSSKSLKGSSENKKTNLHVDSFTGIVSDISSLNKHKIR